MNLGVIDSIARTLGEIMEVDFDETTISRVQFVRVRINWNVDRPLRFQRNYQFTPGVNTVISFFYERLRGFCDVCGMLSHDAGNCLIQNGGVNNSDGEEDDDGDHQVYHGNPGVHIQELDENDQPIEDNAVAAEEPVIVEENHNENQEAIESDEDAALPDIDPDHNALIDISPEHIPGMSRGEWDNKEEALPKPIPSFANFPGDILSPADLLVREIRKRKQDSEIDEDMGNLRKKTSVPVHQSWISRFEKGSGSRDNSTQHVTDGAAVGPVPPPVP